MYVILSWLCHPKDLAREKFEQSKQKFVNHSCAGSSRPPRGETGVGGRPAKGLVWLAGEQRINIWWKT